MKARMKIIQKELGQLSEYLPGAIIAKNGLPFLQLDTAVGAGQIHCVALDQGLIAMEFDLNLIKDHELVLNASGSHSAYLFYCLNGNCFHKFTGKDEVTKLEALQTVVMFNDNSHQSKFLFKKQEHVVLHCVKVDLDVYDGSSMESGNDLVSLLKSYHEQLGYLHYGKFNLEIAQLIKQLEYAKFVDSISSLINFHGLSHMILAKQLEQFKIDVENGAFPSSTLLKRELETISEISDFIQNYPELPHSINSITAKTGLSPSKLQIGFKFMHALTLGEYIRLVRLKKSEQLIRKTDLNISQVVYSIGFTSRSYFCKIFKKQYGCSPKAYQSRAQDATILN